MGSYRKLGCLFLLGILISCGKDDETDLPIIDSETPEIEVPVLETPDPVVPDPVATLTVKEIEFIEEYEYITFNLAPDSYGANRNEKWGTDLKIFLDGAITDDYKMAIENELEDFSNLFGEEITCSIVGTQEASNVHLVFGDKEAIEFIWPDMFADIGDVNFDGYALYSRNGEYHITTGRIWVKNASVPLFRHEFGHILGLGHASDAYCSGALASNESFMCSFLKPELSVFDIALIQTLYHPNIEVGKTFAELQPTIEALLLSEEVVVE